MTSLDISASDNRLYRVVTLSNELQCLLISDETTEKSSAAMDVRVGHLSDPDDLPGLAHFLEHMLFMGSAKYPAENEYNVYLSKNGGSSNAFTDMEDTNYYFDVNADYLEGALDRFAQFFIEPLFLEDSVDREVCAVDSENAKNLQNDFWRMFQLQKSLCREDHPFHKFGSGNFKTLRDGPKDMGINLRGELLRFHEQFYSANIMKVVVLGKESLDELESMAAPIFSLIPNKDINTPQFPGKPYRPEDLGMMVKVVPIREVRTCEMIFPMSEVESLYKKKPCSYLSHLLGHEGPGSILALLKKRGWANDLSAGESRSCSDWSAFAVSIDLTEEGIDRVDDVVEIVFAYISMIRKSGPQKWVFDETSEVANCSFRFLSKRRPISYTCSLAGYMHLYEPEHFISGPYKLFQYDPASIEECLSFMTPANLLLVVAQKKFEGETKLSEKWYGTDYDIESIDDKCVSQWLEACNTHEKYDGNLRLPDKNDLISTDFSIREEPDAPQDSPRLLIDSAKCRVWYKPDNVFTLPKLNVLVRMKSTVVTESPEASVLALLWIEVLDEQSVEFTYMASMAGLHCNFSNATDGIELHLSGYNHKLNILLAKVIRAINELHEKLDENLFERIKDKVSKRYQNFLLGSQPYQHAIYGMDLCMDVKKFSIFDKMEAISHLTTSDLKAFSKRFLRRFFVEILVHGNSSPSEAQTIATTIVDGLASQVPFASTLPTSRVIQLKDRVEYVHRFAGYNPNNPNSVLQTLFQIGVTDLKNNSILSLLAHLIQEPAFDELRTQEQLGYIVHTSVKTNGPNIKSLMFLIQSDSHEPQHLNDRVEAFISRFRERLVAMSDKEYKSNASAVIEEFLEKNKNLAEESSKYWNVINNKSYLFRRFQLLAAEIEKLSKTQLLQFFDRYIAKDGAQRKKINVQVFGSSHLERMSEETVDAVVISDGSTVDFKQVMPLFPLPPTVGLTGMKM